MSSFEIVPILSGLLLGAFLGMMNPGSLRIGLPAALALGFLATIASGEIRISWIFLMEDIPLVGLSAALGFFAINRVGGLGRGLPRPGPGRLSNGQLLAAAEEATSWRKFRRI